MRFGKQDDEMDDLVDGTGDVADEGDEPSQIPLMTGGIGSAAAGDIDYQSMSEGSKIFNKSTMLILAVLLIAAGALYAMRLSQGDNKQSEEARKSEAKIEQIMTQLKSAEAMGGDHSLAKSSIEALMNDAAFIISQLDVDPSKRQVPVEFTKKNPFFIFVDRAADAPTPKIEPDLEAQKQAELIKRLETELSRFRIQSIIPTGPRPVAIIDNKIVQLGETVGSFKIKEIQKLAVVLTAEDRDFILSIESDPNKPEIRRVRDR